MHCCVQSTRHRIPAEGGCQPKRKFWFTVAYEVIRQPNIVGAFTLLVYF